MNELTIVFTFKSISGVIKYLDFKHGVTRKAVITEVNWVKPSMAKFSYLYPKKQLRIKYQFFLKDKVFEKEEDDLYFKYEELKQAVILKKGKEIDINIPKSKNPNKVTVNDLNKSVKHIISFIVLALISFIISSLVAFF